MIFSRFRPPGPIIFALLGSLLTIGAAWTSYSAGQGGKPDGYGLTALLLAGALILLGRAAGLVATVLVLVSAMVAAVIRAGSLSISASELAVCATAVAVTILGATLFYALRRKGWVPAISILLVFVTIVALSLGAIRNTLPPVETNSVYVTMDDGVRLAADYHLPRGYDGTARPAVITFSRYHRATRLRFPFNLVFSTESGNTRRFIEAGYAVVKVDVRGAGASFGNRPQEFSEREKTDYTQIVDWVIAQPWSNGTVGADGVSYSGTAAELLMLEQHPAVKAIAAQYSLFDAYDDAAYPGGLENTHITRAWGQMLHALDMNKPPPGVSSLARLAWGGVRPVDGPDGAPLLQEAIAEHELNYDFSDGLDVVEFRDDSLNGTQLFAGSPSSYSARWRKNKTPILLISGWLDGGYQASAFKKFLNSENPNQYLVIGPWDHGPATSIDPCEYHHNARRGNRSSFTLPFFDYYLRGISNSYDDNPSIRYYMLCGAAWYGSETWPPSERTHRLYLTQEGLSQTPSAESAVREHKVDPSETSGPSSRWAALVRVPGTGPATGYADRTFQSQKLLNFTSQPLAGPLEIAGHPQLHILIESSKPDGALIVYLEDVAPDGNVTYVTEGILRLGNRKPLPSPHYQDYSPVRSHFRSDFEPMPVGESVKIEIGLLPVAYHFGAGHRIRLSIAGADKDNFRALDGPTPVYRVHWAPDDPSYLRLPLETLEPKVWQRPELEYPRTD